MGALIMLALCALVVAATPVVAHNGGPCNDSDEPGNSDYAQHHIRPMAQDGDVGATDHDDDGMSHTPGSHQGYSACQ